MSWYSIDFGSSLAACIDVNEPALENINDNDKIFIQLCFMMFSPYKNLSITEVYVKWLKMENLAKKKDNTLANYL